MAVFFLGWEQFDNSQRLFGREHLGWITPWFQRFWCFKKHNSNLLSDQLVMGIFLKGPGVFGSLGSTWPTDWEAPAMKEAIAPHTCGWHLWHKLMIGLLHLVLVAGFFWVCMWYTEVLYINISTPCYMWLKCRFKHILKTLGCQLRIWSGQTCWATCWPIPKLTLTYILSPWKFEKTSLPKVLDLDVKNKASKKGEYQQISSQGNRNMDT